MKLTKWQDSDSEVIWFSEEINHGDWPFRFALQLKYLEEEAEIKDRYLVMIHAVSPVAASEKIGLGPEDIRSGLVLYDTLLEQGISALLWSKKGNNRRLLLAAARKELLMINFMFGFYMDRPLNAIGSTGWDFIKGDIMAGLARKDKVQDAVT